MKMKYLVLGASRVGLRLLLAQSVLGASTAWAKPKILDGSLVGWWRFDNPSNYKEDSSGYGSSINSDISNGTLSSSGGYSGGRVSLSKSKSFTATLADSAPAIPGTAMPYYTMATRFKSGESIISGLAAIGVDSEVKNVINDTSNWHFGALRYQCSKNIGDPNTGSDKNCYAVILDPRYNESSQWIKTDGTEDKDKPLEMASTSASFLMSYKGKTVTIGGSLKGQSWCGDLDEVMVFARMLSKREVARLRYTGESYVYCTSDSPSFGSSSGWSYCEGTYAPAPGGIFGAPYLVDNGLTMSQGGTATFGGEVNQHLSLTLGRVADLTYMNGNVNRTVTKIGNFNHSSAGTLTFYDLRLVNGKFTGVAGGTLNTTLLDIDTPSGSMFEINVPSGVYTITSANAVTGDGTLKKTGAGTLDLTGLTGAAKVVVTEGKVLAGPNVTVSYAEDEGAVPVLMVE